MAYGNELSFQHANLVTPSDTLDLTFRCMGLLCGTGGTCKIDTEGGETITLTLVAGTIVWLSCRRIWSTGTTAATILALS